MSGSAFGLALLALALAGAALLSLAALRGWRGWLDLQRMRHIAPAGAAPRSRELARLRERVRRLEAIADGRS